MKKNNLRKIYLIYIIAIGELVLAATMLASGYIPVESWRLALRILFCAGFVLMPVFLWLMYRWLKKDNAAASDELEQMILIKALAAGGLVSVTLVPFLLVLVSLFSDWASLIVFVYTALVWGTVKISTFVLYKKY